MQKYGRVVMMIAVWLAVIGLFLSEPAGEVPSPYHLFNFLIHGLEIRLFQDPVQPSEFALRMSSIDWLMYCLALFLLGALLAVVSYFWHAHDGDRPIA
ncbi:hypothetical protein [Paracidovorax citrulli]